MGFEATRNGRCHVVERDPGPGSIVVDPQVFEASRGDRPAVLGEGVSHDGNRPRIEADQPTGQSVHRGGVVSAQQHSRRHRIRTQRAVALASDDAVHDGQVVLGLTGLAPRPARREAERALPSAWP